MKLISICVAALSGLTAGVAFGGAALALGVITRATAIFSGERAGAGWAATLGATFAAFMYLSGLRLPPGGALGILALTLGGAFVGMVSAALAELLELMPVLIVRSRLAGLALPAVIALMLGKALGALLAALICI